MTLLDQLCTCEHGCDSCHQTGFLTTSRPSAVTRERGVDWNSEEDRARERADRMAEIAAIDAGHWPRSAGDVMRWHRYRYLTDAQHRAHVRRMCVMTIDAIDAKDAIDIINTPPPGS